MSSRNSTAAAGSMETLGATHQTREEKIDVGNLADALLVEVDISMESGAANAPATRQLMFWFVKGKGLVKRDFGASTSRVPAEAKG